MCVGDAQDPTAPWVFKHRLYSKVKGQAAVETDLSEKLSMEVLGYSEVGAVKSASASAPKSTVTLGKMTSTQTVKVRLLAREDVRCEMWGSLVVNYSVLQEAGRREASWVPGSISLKMLGVWAPEEGEEAGSAGLTVTMGAFKRAVSSGGAVAPAPSPVGTFALVVGGTLPASSELGAVPVETFYIGKTEVTWGEWKTVRTWAAANGYTDLANVGQGVGDNYPVTHVNWYDCVKWCNARSEKEGRAPVYNNGAAVYRTGNVSEPAVVVSANGYRLPSEKEWEFAARGGTQTQGYTYSGSNNLNAVGWYYENSGNAVHEVGKKLANELGIYDMSGNLLEWCGSLYVETHKFRVLRSGEWLSVANQNVVSFRGSNYPEPRYNSSGFRVATSGEYALGITGQPSVLSDGTNLSVQAAGVGTLTYQWKLNGVAIAGATSSQLPTRGLQSGAYTVAVSNGVASVTSESVRITIMDALGFVFVSGGTLPASSQLGALPVESFYIGKTEVTWGEWKTVRTWAVANGYTDLANVGRGAGDNFPVSHVNWYDAVKWCNARSEKEGKIPVYENGAAVYRTGNVSEPAVVVSANGYRLPSEKEWEFAARGGTQTKGYIYSGSNNLNAVGWYRENSGNAVQEVGQKQANELGIYDMSGNLWEWSGSWYPGFEGSYRVIRGGPWYDLEGCTVTARFGVLMPGNSNSSGGGFRVALSSVPEMVLVTGGTLPASSELGAVPVDTFYIGKREVTWGEWKAVRDWALVNGYDDLGGVGQGVGENYPVTNVNWFDVVKWCNARSEKEGKTPVYTAAGAVYKIGQVTPTEVALANGYRLPSQKEWEFAARGGTQTQGYTYSGSNNLNAVGWYYENSGNAVHEVGNKLANELGIYDMSGNLSEWSGSWYPDFEGEFRVIQGGGWNFRAGGCTVAFRDMNDPKSRIEDYGFRVALSAATEMALVVGGTLPASSELGAVPVETFYIGKTEVTWGEWKTVLTWALANGYTDLYGVGQGADDNFPVSHVNWYDCVKWCNARSEREGKTPVYKNGTAVYRTGNVSEPAIVVSANGYRLPSEKEWEFAARGGTQTKGYIYSGGKNLGEVGWFRANSVGAVHEVGKKLANELGIFDMSGNLWEWSGSWYPQYSGSYRVIRGGDWSNEAGYCTVAVRYYDLSPGYRSNYHGFRMALSSVP
jgi:formylglycine-generating enzyme required for sulfatase activity